MIRGMTATTLIFDVMGTVVDIEGSIAAQAREVLDLDDDALATFLSDWEDRLEHEMGEIIAGRAQWRPHRELRAAALGDDLDPRRRASATVIHRLDPWPEAAEGLARLREIRHVVALSNADLRELVDLSAHGGLAWHALLSAQFARSYKPDPVVYDMALELLGIEPAQAMLVAAHPWDLRAAAARGYSTAYIARPSAVAPRPTTPSTSTTCRLPAELRSFPDCTSRPQPEPRDDACSSSRARGRTRRPDPHLHRGQHPAAPDRPRAS